MTMRFSATNLGAALVACAFLFVPTSTNAQGYRLVWSDEFDQGFVDPANWGFDLEDGCQIHPDLCGWGNGEDQWYQAQNATVSGGFLRITAKNETVAGYDYTSARLKTKGKFDFTFGRVEMRAKLPVGEGMWPAFWLLFTNETYGGWAASGEIDIMEYRGVTPAEDVIGAIHYGAPAPGNRVQDFEYFLPSGTFADAFHTFAIEWEPGEIRWYVDGTLFACEQDWWSSGGAYPAPFDHDFHILLNCAVGGNLGGVPPFPGTVFPQDYVIDYVRVYQKPEFTGCRVIFAGMDDPDLFNDGWFAFDGNGGGGINFQTVLPPQGGCLGSHASGWGGPGPFLGVFGRTNPSDLTDMTHFSFWIDPLAGQSYDLHIQLQEDDNNDDTVPATPDGQDDEFQYILTVRPSGGDVVAGGGWQYVSIPLSSFVDDNSYHFGGNGVFDPFYLGNGRLVNIAVSVFNLGGSNANFSFDRWEFTRKQATLQGTVWNDLDGDGVREGGEMGLSGVTVNVRDLDLNLVATDVTDAQGLYSFTGISGGELRVEVANGVPSGFTPSTDPDGVLTPEEAWVALDCDAVLSDQDFGYQQDPFQLIPYSQDFEGLTQSDPNALANDGWLVFANVFIPPDTFDYGYGFPAPNDGAAFCTIVSGQGDAEQGAQQLSVFSDYDNADHGNGKLIESNVYQEQIIGTGDLGRWNFRFDAKRGNLAGSTSALAFIKTLDPKAGFALTNFITVDMTSIPATWSSYSSSITIDGALIGQLLQFGFANTATNFEESGIYYDNVFFGPPIVSFDVDGFGVPGSETEPDFVRLTEAGMTGVVALGTFSPTATSGGVTVTAAATGGWRDRGVPPGPQTYPQLVRDFLWNDGPDGGSITVTISGLPAGDFTATSFHHDHVVWAQDNSFDILVDDAAGTGRLVVDDADWLPNTNYLGETYVITSNGNDDVVLHIREDSALNRVRFNGIVVTASGTATAVEDPQLGGPANFYLTAAPNPFNPATTIRFGLPEDVRVQLDVFDVRGRRVARLLDKNMKAGVHTVPFRPRGLASGVYFYRMEAGGFSETKKIVLLQ